MFEIKLTVDIPDLVKAAQLLTGGKGYLEKLEALKTQIPDAVPPYNAPAGPVLPQPNPTPITPVVTMPAEAQVVPTTVTVPAPVTTPVTTPVTAPTAAPAFTLAQVARAGAQLLTAKPALQNDLMALLGRYGAKTAQDLPQDRLGEFAAELRQMGAQI